MSMSIRRFSSALILAAALSGLALAGAPTSARAATLVGSATFVIGVNGLVVDGSTYDVAFTGGSYNSVFSARLPTFLNNSSGASDAAAALVTALNTLLPTPLFGLFDPSIPDTVRNATSWNGIQVTESGGNPFSSVAAGALLTQVFFLLPGDEEGFAVFTQVAPVPEPATWALLVLGFAGIGFVAHRRKSKPALMTA